MKVLSFLVEQLLNRENFMLFLLVVCYLCPAVGNHASHISSGFLDDFCEVGEFRNDCLILTV